MAKIRINDLAKELGVPSKAILDKCIAENIDFEGKKPTGAISISLGLAETIKEWASEGAFASAAVAVAEKPKKAPAKKKGGKATSDDPHADETSNDEHADSAGDTEHATSTTRHATSTHADSATAAATVVEPAAVDTAAAPSAVSDPSTHASHEPATIHAPSADASASAASSAATSVDAAALHPVPAEQTQPVASQANAIPASGASSVATSVASPSATPSASPTPSTRPEPAIAPAAVEVPTPATFTAPAIPSATSAPTASATPAAAHPATGRGGPQQPQTRPTVKLEDRLAAERDSRPRPQPVAFTPKKAEVKGPALIREEKPDFAPAPRARPRPGGPGGPGDRPGGPPGPSSLGTARPNTGRGVRTGAGDGEEDEKKKGKAGTSRSVRRSPDGRRGEADEKLREFTEADLIERRDKLFAATSYRAGLNQNMRKSGQARHGPAQTAAQRGGPAEIEEPITVKSLSLALGVKVNDIIGKLMKTGVFATINQPLDFDSAATLALDWGVELAIKRAKTLEEIFMDEFEAQTSDEANLVLRPPVVTILGHVDHGKTSLLDKIRSANVAAGEAGGITQHIAAFSVELDREGTKKRVTFIDTPGHQAFTAMRARGANMTDVVVLVVDAAQGMQPQTVESINHARAAGVPIVVAINKIDLPDANPDMVLGQMAQNELNPVAWGGQTETVQTSGRTGQGVDELIEILDLQSQILELKCDPTAPARGVVIESQVNQGLGPVATVLVQDGTLKVGDILLAGNAYGRVRSLYDSNGRPVQSAGPSTPVVVAGLSSVSMAGDKFFQIDDLDRAMQIAEQRAVVTRQQQLAVQNRASLQNISEMMKSGDVKTINLIVKADVAGSIETLAKTITDQNTSEVQVKLIHSAVGPINESDVELATASDAVIIGFHVTAEPAAQSLAEARKIEIRTYRVIYEIFDDLKKALSGMLEPEIREKHHGWIEIRQVFKVSRIGNVAGCFVTEGHISRGSKIRLVRDGNVITEGLTIDTLRRIKDDTKEVKQGLECGIKLANYDDIKVGDKLEAYVREEIKRTL